MSIAETVLQELIHITGTDEVRKNIELDLFGEKVLDSFGSVELIVALSNAFNIELSPGQMTREEWATPQKIIRYMEEKVGK